MCSHQMALHRMTGWSCVTTENQVYQFFKCIDEWWKRVGQQNMYFCLAYYSTLHMTSVFIWKYFQDYYYKLKHFIKLCKPKSSASVTVPRSGKILEFFLNKEVWHFSKGLVRKWELLTEMKSQLRGGGNTSYCQLYCKIIDTMKGQLPIFQNYDSRVCFTSGIWQLCTIMKVSS
jgi:hypothetical protein